LERRKIGKSFVTAVIPFYNPENILTKVITETLPHVDDLVLVNDGSTRNLDNIIPRAANIHYISLANNSGKGAALKRGFDKAIELGSKFIISLDSDYQHDPKFIPTFLEALKTSDFVIGKRHFTFAKMPIARVFSNTITSKILSFKTHQKIFDSQSGYRGFNASIIKKILPSTNGFEAESEMILLAAKNGIQISFIDISTKYDNEKSEIKVFSTIFNFIKVILK